MLYMPFVNLQAIIANFFTHDDVFSAKKKLFEIAEQMFGEGNIGRCSKRQGDCKRKLDTADLLNLYQDLDVRQAKLPFFVAAVMSKIPGIRPIDSDVISL